MRIYAQSGFEDPGVRALARLHVCPCCACELVQPVAWAPASGDQWLLRLECPNCRWTAKGSYDRGQIERLERRLEDGFARMLEDLRRLKQANIVERIDRFIAALWADLILPEDF
jgi:hypothetical protein